MADRKLLSATVRVQLKCRGRDAKKKPVLKRSVKVLVDVRGSSERTADKIATQIIVCKHNTGGHGQRCKASHPEGVDKVGDGVNCPLSFDWPYVLEGKPNWECPEELKGIFNSLKDL